MPRSSPAARLRQLLAEPGIVVMPGFHDALSGRLLAQAGVRLGFMSGFAVAMARLGLPDTGLISFTEMLGAVRDISEASPDFLFVADGDTGYGNALNVQRTVRAYAQAGAAAVMIEDQVMPKRCDEAVGKQVISRAEARLKIRAAVATARDSDILVLARSDARTVLGFEEALARCQDFAEEGADIIFLDSPANEEELARFCQAVPQPCMASMLLGGKSAPLSPAGLQGLGVKIVTYPHAMIAAATQAMQQMATAMMQADPAGSLPAFSDFATLKNVAGFDEYFVAAEQYK